MRSGKRAGAGLFAVLGLSFLALVSSAWVLVSPGDDPRPGPALYAARGSVAAVGVLWLGVLALHHRARQAQAAEAKVWEILESAPAGVVIVDGEGRITFVNRRGEILFGHEPGTLIGQPIETLVPYRLREAIQEHLAGGSRPDAPGGYRPWIELLGRRRDGGELPIEVNLDRFDPGRGSSVTCVFRDLSERKQAEQRLQAANEALQLASNRFRSILEGTRDPIAAIDREFRLIAFNRAFKTEFRAVFGKTVQLGMTVADALEGHPKASDEALGYWRRALAGESFTVLMRLGGEPDNPNTYEITFNPIRDDDGQLIGAAHIVRDITARLRAERAFDESRRLLQAVLDNSKAVIYVKDTEGRYVLINRWFEILFRLTRDQIIGRTDLEVFAHDPARAEVFRANDQKILDSGVAQEFEEEAPHEDGPHTYISIKFPLLQADGVPRALCGISTDITHRKRMEEQLRHQNLRLLEATRAERQAHEALEQTHVALRQVESQLEHAEKLSALGGLVAGIAHEIKNPLAAAIGNVGVFPRDIGSLHELIRLYQQADDALAAHRPEVLALVRELADQIDLEYTLNNLEQLAHRTGESLWRIQQLCQDLLNFARPETFTLCDADINEGARATVNLVTGRARAQQVEIEVALTPLPLVRCAPGRINQVLLNLLINAIDACPRNGRVTLRTQPGPDRVEVHVIDTGQGIEPSIRDRIFDPFFSTKPVGEGTGLGLSISAQIVRAHGGQIEFESTPGRGSHFVAWLPRRQPADAPQ